MHYNFFNDNIYKIKQAYFYSFNCDKNKHIDYIEKKIGWISWIIIVLISY